MDVSVIIVNYNTKSLLKDCLTSIYKQTREITFEIIVVDNYSVDGSQKMVMNNFPDVILIESITNLGFGRANNIGMKFASGKYFFLLNSDTFLLNNAIKLFRDYAETNNPIAFYGCWLENSEGTFIHSCASLPSIKSILKNFIGIYTSKMNLNVNMGTDLPYCENECLKVGYITGADMFFHRLVFERTKGFDENFFMYYEESDWQKKSQKKGIYSYCINGPRIIHLVGGSLNSKKYNIDKNDIIMNSMCYYVYKHYGKLRYFCFRIAYAIINLPLLCFARSLNLRDRIQAISLLFKSYMSLMIQTSK